MSVTGFLESQNKVLNKFNKEEAAKKKAAAKAEKLEAEEKEKAEEKEEADKKKKLEEDTEGQSEEEKANAKKADEIADEELHKNQVATKPPTNAEEGDEHEAACEAKHAGEVDPKAVGAPDESDAKKLEKAEEVAADPKKELDEQMKQKQRDPDVAAAPAAPASAAPAAPAAAAPAKKWN